MDLRGLDKKLQHSFQNYKVDVTRVKDNVSRISDGLEDLKSAVSNLKESSITKDKINLLKIKIGEVNDQLKKTWALEEEFKELETRTIGKEFFNQQFDSLNDEFDDLKASMVMLNKEAVSELQVKELIDDLNDEFNKIRNSIEDIRNIKDSITQKELEKRTNKLNNKIDNFRAEYKKFEDKARSFSTRSQLDELSKGTSKSIDDLKKAIDGNKRSLSHKVSEIKITGFDTSIKELKKMIKEKVSETEIHNLVGEVNKEFSGIKKEMSKIEKGIKSKVENKSLDKIKQDIKNVNDSLKKDVKILNDSMRGVIVKKDIKTFVKENRRLKSDMNKFKQKMEKGIDEDFSSMDDFFKKEVQKITAKVRMLESKDIKAIKKNSVTKKEFDNVQKDLRENINSLNERLDSANKNSLEKKAFDNEKKNLQNAVKNINQNIHQIKTGYARNSDVERLKEYIERLERKLFRNKDSFIPQKTIKIGRVAPKMEKVIKAKKLLNHKRSIQSKYNAGNFLIGIAFALLITSIVLFFLNKLSWMNGFAIGAVVSFIIGILVRVSVISKRRKGVE